MLQYGFEDNELYLNTFMDLRSLASIVEYHKFVDQNLGNLRTKLFLAHSKDDIVLAIKGSQKVM